MGFTKERGEIIRAGVLYSKKKKERQKKRRRGAKQPKATKKVRLTKKKKERNIQTPWDSCMQREE